MAFALRLSADVTNLVNELASWTLWQTRAARNGTPSAQAVKASLADLPPALKEIIAEEGGWSFYDIGPPEELPPVGACHEAAPWCPSLVKELRMRPELMGAERNALEDMLELLYTGNEMETCSIGCREAEREALLEELWWHEQRERHNGTESAEDGSFFAEELLK